MSQKVEAAFSQTWRWHSLAPQEALSRLDAESRGLAQEEAQTRLERFGPNALPSPPRRSDLQRFLAQFQSVLIYVLIGAAVITAFLQHWVDAGVIVAVVLINAIIGFIQEGRAEKALDAIRDMLAPNAVVLRDGHRVTVPATELVPGDIVVIEAGDKVPADLRLLDVHALRIEEAALTGESVAVDKSVQPVAEDAALGDRTPMAYSGTLVTYGQGRGVAVETGANTEIGRISGLIQTVETLSSPLIRAIDLFGRKLTVAILAISVFVFFFGWLIRDYTLVEMFMAVVGIAVAAIPEGLPAVITITLALGVEAMARRRAIARKLPAIETLGSVSVICSDKTGTITRNEMSVARLSVGGADILVEGSGYAPSGDFRLANGSPVPETVRRGALQRLAETALLASDAEIAERDGKWVVDGDPMEGALVAFAGKAGLTDNAMNARQKRLATIPFDARHRYMATLDANARDEHVIHVKGAPDRLIELATHQDTPDGVRPIDPEFWQDEIERLASSGYRVLALARKPVGSDCRSLDHGDLEDGLVLDGLVALEDPPREEAIASIEQCQRAGIAVKMITGDHAVTAKAIARRIGLGNPERALTGAQLDALAADDLDRAVADTNVFARTSPENKLRLIEALQSRGHVIAMTGDGVNDAPALKRADIGVSMGQKGSEAAKEASDLVLADDNFATLANAVEEGRRIYDNITKTILFMLPTNAGEALVLVGAILMGLPLPITPVQILWINLVTAITLALALAFDPAEPGIMQRPPRDKNAPILSSQLVWRTIFVALVFMAGVFAVYSFALMRGFDIETARTAAANTLVGFEIAFLFVVRRQSRFSAASGGVMTRILLLAVVTVLTLQILFTYAPPLQLVFDTRPLPLNAVIAIALMGLAVFLIVEAEIRLQRWFKSRRHRWQLDKSMTVSR